MALVTYPIYRWLEIAPPRRPTEAAVMSLPGMFLDELLVFGAAQAVPAMGHTDLVNFGDVLLFLGGRGAHRLCPGALGDPVGFLLKVPTVGGSISLSGPPDPPPMRVFVAGATGVLGRRIVRGCSASGHEVVGLTRDSEGDRRVSERGGKPVRGDVLDSSALLEAADGADVLVHAATAIPTEVNPPDSAWTRNDRVRRVGAKNLVETAGEIGADRVLLQSIVWVARQPAGRVFDETDDPHPDRSTKSALEAERIVTRGAETHGYEPVVLRGGYFYAPDTAHTQLFRQKLLAADLPIIGRGLLGRRDARLSFVHVDDMGRAFVEAIEGSATGRFHVVDDEPTTYASFVRTFAELLEAPEPSRLPAWLARLFIDDNLIRLLTRPMPTTNAKFRQAFEWEPRYPTIEEGLEQVVETWRRNQPMAAAEGAAA